MRPVDYLQKDFILDTAKVLVEYASRIRALADKNKQLESKINILEKKQHPASILMSGKFTQFRSAEPDDSCISTSADATDSPLLSLARK